LRAVRITTAASTAVGRKKIIEESSAARATRPTGDRNSRNTDEKKRCTPTFEKF
jgi:hypothetical protein